MTGGSPGPSAAPVLRFFGAARTVTGSLHLLEANGDKVLLDCGLFQGKRSEARERNLRFPFDPREITTVVLSHAHIDHAGNLPNLVKQGFEGRIICTPATLDLAAIMLEDSAAIQERDAEYLNRKTARAPGTPPVQPLYTVEDARRVETRLEGYPYGHGVEVARGVRCTFGDAGHILGSAWVALEVEAAGISRRVTFTGDIGRSGMPIIRDPAPIPAASDVVISESTYGDRRHEPLEDQEAKLRDIVRRTAERGGKLIVPAFSVGRTQNLVYLLHKIFLAGGLPPLPIFVDSPLSAKTTMVYRAHPECYDDATSAAFLAGGRDPFGFARLTYVAAVEDSKALNVRKGPFVIIASSGMCEAGRILHHLKHGVGDPRNTVLIVGFQAEHTLGRRLVEKAPAVRIYGEEHAVRAEVAKMNGLSAHADQAGLLAQFEGLARPRATRGFLVHGEEAQMMPLAARVRDLGVDCAVPARGDAFEI